jgi:ribosomal protein S18 acetylase RimI-like enzyme
MAWTPDAPTVRRLLWHESQVHSVPDRVLRDLGDGILLHDPRDAEPFWNRLAAVHWPSDPGAFDRRLAEVGVLFASIGRRPHIWLLPPFDEPADLAVRLLANGFEDTGPGCVMAAHDDVAARMVLARPTAPGVALERFSGTSGPDASDIAEAIVGVLLGAFDVDVERRPGVIAETQASLADPRFTHYLVRVSGVPAAVCRRATFDGLTYLSSIGTLDAARGQGLGRLVTARAMADAFAAGSQLVHLGVFVDNAPAIALYERLGFAFVGRPGPDMILTR